MDDSSQIISAGGAEIVSLPITASILASSLMSLIIIYSILILLLIAIIWLVVRKKLWNLWKKSNTDYSPNQNYFLSSLGISCMIEDQKFKDKNYCISIGVSGTSSNLFSMLIN